MSQGRKVKSIVSLMLCGAMTCSMTAGMAEEGQANKYYSD